MKNKNDKIQEQEVAARKLRESGGKTQVPEAGGRGGLDPVRFGDWEIAGKCVDF